MNFNFFSFVLGQDLHSYHHPALCWLIIKSIRLVSWGWWCKWPCGFGHIRTLSSWLLILCDCPRLFNFPVDMWYATCLGTRPLAPGREYLPPPLVCQCWVIGLDYIFCFILPATRVLWIHFCGCHSWCQAWLIDWWMGWLDLVAMSICFLRPSSFGAKFILNFILMAVEKKQTQAADMGKCISIYSLFSPSLSVSYSIAWGMGGLGRAGYNNFLHHICKAIKYT